MKQHITFEQLNELSKEGKNNYFSWCTESGYLQKTGPIKIKDLPLLSIGQLIEFLDDVKEDAGIVEIDRQLKLGDNSMIGWNVGYNGNHFEKELCDALWEAVKEVLNE